MDKKKSKKEESYWRYEIIKHSDEDRDEYYGLHEVWYEDGKIVGWTKDSMVGFYDSVNELRGTLEMMLSDTAKREPLDMDKLTKLDLPKIDIKYND